MLLKIGMWILGLMRSPKALMWMAAAMIVMIMILMINHWRLEAEKTAQLERALQSVEMERKEQAKVLLDLQNGNSTYAKETRKIVVPHTDLFDADGMRAVVARNKAGRASRP